MKLAAMLALASSTLLLAGQALAIPDADDCARELVHTLSSAAAFYPEDKLAQLDCDERYVYCVDAHGKAVPGERDPQLNYSRSLTIKLLGPQSCLELLKVGTDVQQSDNITLFRAVKEAAADTETRSGAGPVITVLDKATLEADASIESFTVIVSRADEPRSLRGDTLSVIPPRYFLDVGILVAFAPHQEISAARIPGSQELFIREEKGLRPSAAVTLNYFFLGQYSVPRFSGWHGFAVQAGIGGDFSEVDDEFYLGVLWEPIPGAGVSAGLAMIEMDRLQPNYPAGALVSADDVPKDRFLAPQPYFGISLNTQVFETALKLGEKARVPN